MAKQTEQVEVKVGLDYEELAKSVDMVREMVMSLVTAMEVAGFTPREARAVIAGVFAVRSDVEES